MSQLKKLTKRQALIRYAKGKREVITTGPGYVFKLLRFLGLRKIAVQLIRKPWHIGDEYVDGKLERPILIQPRKR